MHTNVCGKSQLVELLGNHMLRDREETVGRLAAIHELDGHVIEAQIEGDDWTRAILLPVSFRPELQGLQCKMVGILRLGGRYYVREVGGG
jgi:hypothetical protein